MRLGVPATVTSFVVRFLVQAPVAVKLVINELLVNPDDAILETNGEWFEVYNAGITPVNFRGFYLGDSAPAGDRPPHRVETDVIAAVGSYTVFGNTTNTTDNGGVPVTYAYGATLALANSSDAVRVLSPAGYVSSASPCYMSEIGCEPTDHVEVDRVRYVAPGTSALRGRSRELVNPALDNANVDGSHWDEVEVADTYGPGGSGTPGAQNRAFYPE